MRRGERERQVTEFLNIFRKAVKVVPALLLTLMKSAGNRGEKHELLILGDVIVAENIAGAGAMTGEQLKPELRRGLIARRCAAPGDNRFARHREEPVDFMRDTGLGEPGVKKESASVCRVAGRADTAQLEEQRGTEGVREKHASGRVPGTPGNFLHPPQILQHLSFDRVIPPPHPCHEVFSKPFPDERGGKAAVSEKLKRGKGHHAVANMIGKPA